MGNERPPRRAQSSTDRDTEGLAALRERQARDGAARLARDAIPGPFEGVDTGVTPRIQEDPDLNRLYTKIAKQSETSTRMIAEQRRETANLVLEVAGERPPAQRFEVIEKRLRSAHWLISALIIPVITAVVLSVRYVYARGGADVRIELEHKQLLQDIADLKTSRDDLSKRMDAATELARQNAAHIDDLFRERPPSRKIDTTRNQQRASSPQSATTPKVTP